mmetsp:Transcript_12396/g.46258  ORF Transcript_12396/g.46258 Transcript_12396/m.46258 type:complete len:236 (+) Transcript_12396:270-977(+)
MHDPASKKLSAPLPSKACRKKSTRIVLRQFSTDPNVLQTYVFNPASLQSSSSESTTNAVGPSILGTCVYLSINISAFGTLWSPRCTTLLPTHPPKLFWHLCSTACMALPTLGADCTRLSPCPVFVSEYLLSCRSKSPSASVQSLNMSFDTSRQSVKLCDTYRNCLSCVCDKRAPSLPTEMPSENSRDSGVFASKNSVKYASIFETGSRLNRKYALLSEIEYKTRKMSSLGNSSVA